MNTREEISKTKRKEETIEKIKNNKSKFKMFIRKLFWIIILIIALCIIYARYIEPYRLVVNEYNVNTNKNISKNFDGLKIVHFSDLHYGSAILEKELIKVVDEINDLKPDIVFFTGDLVEEKYKLTKKDINILKDNLSNIKSNLGNYAIYGNHDIPNKYFETILKDSDFILLENNYDLIYNKDNNPIVVYGVNDVLLQHPSMDNFIEELNNYTYKILLVHEGDYINDVLGYNFDLALAGHSHNGQVRLPVISKFFMPDGCKDIYAPHYKINNTEVYVSNGIGTSLLKLRFNSVPSINLYRISKNN